MVRFSPAGVVVSSAEEETRRSYYVQSAKDWKTRDSAFLRALLATTALRQVVGHWTRPVDDSPYEWWAPERALQMFEFLSEPIDTPSPKFVFAHIIKPHEPATFDRHGNVFLSKGGDVGFSDVHDPTVPDSYIGQLIFVNSLVLRVG